MTKKQENNTTESDFVFSKNIAIAAALVVIIAVFSLVIPGYKHIIYDVAIDGNKTIDKIENKRLNFNQPELSLQDKRMLNIDNYWYISAIQKSTPQSPDVVVLLPPRSYLADNLAWANFANSEWMEYFVYPRLVISEDEKEIKPELYKKVTHVAVIKNWGFDRLHYTPQQLEEYAIYPIDSFQK